MSSAAVSMSRAMSLSCELAWSASVARERAQVA